MFNQTHGKKNKGNNNRPVPAFHMPTNNIPDRGESLHEKVNRPSGGGEEFDMDALKRQLAKVSALAAWGVSIYFSYEGFKFQNTQALWVGYFLAFLVTCGEFIFNTEIKKLSLTLILIGIVCYAYGTYSNVVGFWSIQFPMEPFDWKSSKSIMSWFVGAILEIYPEAAFAWGMKSSTGDFVGNLVSIAGGQKHTYQMSDEMKMRIGK